MNNNITPDPEYDFIAPLPPNQGKTMAARKGSQCGECGMKFEYGKSYGYFCGNQRCPTGWNRS